MMLMDSATATVGMGTTTQSGTNPSVLNPVAVLATSTAYNVGQGLRTDSAEGLDGTARRCFQPDGILNRESHRYCKVTRTES